ncbi:hypothetical protein FDP41_009829 [Naegleria fowleri]|uniref:Prolyl 4-hydroxylase alpha subunit domain-containing protein n=1 Tax=Naegleria fowleri TaxID=5763 RepID=A0A6A5AVW6_NAEFO|nr:uncharacterized protein FDP41_009829 [Naegleria fowleri]KAF0972133.1 hypothetical protein FDP41_009829 [Naegleria fowleri]
MSSTPSSNSFASHALTILEPGLTIRSNQKITWNLDDYSVRDSFQNKPSPIQCSDRLIVIPDFLSSEECSSVLDQCAKKQQFESIATEYPQSYRNSERMVFKDKSVAHHLWKLVQENLDCEELSRKVHPFGLDSNGRWMSCGVNECLRFSKYEEGNYFRPHIDGQFVRHDHERSIYTLLIYLNDDFEGGETRFMKPCNPDEEEEQPLVEQKAKDSVVKQKNRRDRETEKKRVKMGIPSSSSETSNHIQQVVSINPEKKKHFHLLYTLKPTLGMCALFNHDLYHEGMIVTKGTKLILRTEIMFKRVDSLTVPRDECFERSEFYKRIASLFTASDDYEKKGQVREATELYITAQDLLMESGRSMDHVLNKSYFHYKTCSSYKEPNVLDFIENELTELPEEILLHIFTFLADKIICTKILTLNKYFNVLGRHPQLWQQIYRTNWGEDKTFGYLKQREELEVDWYFSTITRRYFEKDFVTVCIDMRKAKTMYGLFNSDHEKTVESMVSQRKGGHCMLGKHSSWKAHPCLQSSGSLKKLRTLTFFISHIYKNLNLCLGRHPLLFSLPPQWMNNEETSLEVLNMMMEIRIPAACMAPRHLLVALAYQLPTCMVIELDDCGVSISAVIDNYLSKTDSKFIHVTVDDIEMTCPQKLVHKFFYSEDSFIPSLIREFTSGKDLLTKKQLLENIILTGNWNQEHINLICNSLKQTSLSQTCNFVIGNIFDAFYGGKIYCSLPDFRSKCTFWPGKEL